MTTKLIDYNAETLTWYQRNERSLSNVAVIIGVALAAISLGYFVASFGSLTKPSSITNYAYADNATRNLIANATVGQALGAFALMPMGIGVFVVCCGAYMRYKANKRLSIESTSAEKAKIKADAKKWKSVALIAGFAIAMFGVGMIIASSVLLKHQIPNMQDLINKHPGDTWWQSLQDSWLDPTKMKLNLFLTGGVFAALGGGGLMVAGVGVSKIREKLKLMSAEKREVTAQKAVDEVL